jgi:replicative DNA helicase
LRTSNRLERSSTSIPSGLQRLDDLTGGFDLGQVWIVTGTPGQGRTTLVTQWAAALAVSHGWRTRVACPREAATMCAARLISSTGKVSLSHVLEHRLDTEDARRAEVARNLLARADLQVAPEGKHFSLSVFDDNPADSVPTAVLLDDADLIPSCSAERVARLAQAGRLVVLTLPRHLMVHGDHEDADLRPDWARVADVVLEVRSRGLTPGDPDGRAGEADLTVLKHRRGPTATAPVAFQPFYARSVDLRT